MAPFCLQMAGSIIQFILNMRLSKYGSEIAVGAMGVIGRSTLILIMPIFGINQGVQPIIGYNYGARKYDRVKEALKLATKAATVVCIIGFLILELIPQGLYYIFLDSKENISMITLGVRAMRIYSIAFSLIGFQIIASSFFQSIGKAGISMFLSLSRQVLLLIPLLIFLPMIFGLDGVWFAAPISDFLAAVLSFIMVRVELKKLDKLETKRNNEIKVEENMSV